MYVGTLSNKLIAYELASRRKCPTCVRHIRSFPRSDGDELDVVSRVAQNGRRSVSPKMEEEKGKEGRLLDGIHFVQEVFTEDGLPPKRQPKHAGQIVRVSFKANYVFFGESEEHREP